MVSPQELADLVDEITPQVVELRRLLHRHPEPAHEEHETTDLIRAAIEGGGMPFKGREPKTGGWVDIGSQPRIGFRADLDALPIREPADNVPRSTREGWMHACGHDAHAAIAVGIALTLHRLDSVPTGIRILFQPGEEANPGGAIELVSEGLVDGLKGLIAFHVDPSIPVGSVGSRVGPITGSADGISITINGPGGHTSRPHRTVDLIESAARVVTDLPGAIRRSIDARSPVVMAFGSIHGGDVSNVIPTEVVLKGTVRTLDPNLWDVLPGLIDKALGSILAITGASHTMEYRQGIPPVVNDGRIIATTSTALNTMIDPDTVVGTETSMGGEDFSNYLSVTPGALLRLGASSGGGDLHSASFKVNEAAIGFGIKAGVAALLGLAEEQAGR